MRILTVLSFASSAVPDSKSRVLSAESGVFFGDLSIQALKDNWYMYLNCLDAAPDLYLLNDCEFVRKLFIPTHPELDEVCNRIKEPAAMRAMLNWDRANQLASFYLAYMSGQVELVKCKVPTLGIWSAGDVYLPEESMKKTEEFMEVEWKYERLEEGSQWVMLDQPDSVNRLNLIGSRRVETDRIDIRVAQEMIREQGGSHAGEDRR